MNIHYFCTRMLVIVAATMITARSLAKLDYKLAVCMEMRNDAKHRVYDITFSPTYLPPPRLP